jgi:hypothetical protein
MPIINITEFNVLHIFTSFKNIPQRPSNMFIHFHLFQLLIEHIYAKFCANNGKENTPSSRSLSSCDLTWNTYKKEAITE